jgi:multiple antibiotic resistance protein
MHAFWLCFVPMFVAVDAFGALPLFVSLTDGIAPARKKAIVLQSIATAAIVALIFLSFGPLLLGFLGITVSDFMIAGGILLLAISLNDLLTGEKRQRQIDQESLGAVPLGIPLITGPAVLTTCILLANIHGHLITAAATVLNIALAGFVFLAAAPFTRLLGKVGTKTISKVASMLLAAIAVMLIRRGLVEVLNLTGR